MVIVYYVLSPVCRTQQRFMKPIEMASNSCILTPFTSKVATGIGMISFNNYAPLSPVSVENIWMTCTPLGPNHSMKTGGVELKQNTHPYVMRAEILTMGNGECVTKDSVLYYNKTQNMYTCYSPNNTVTAPVIAGNCVAMMSDQYVQILLAGMVDGFAQDTINNTPMLTTCNACEARDGLELAVVLISSVISMTTLIRFIGGMIESLCAKRIEEIKAEKHRVRTSTISEGKPSQEPSEIKSPTLQPPQVPIIIQSIDM
jgi:hypothetical protein